MQNVNTPIALCRPYGHCDICLLRRLEIHRDDSSTEPDGLKVYLRNKSRHPCWVNGTIRVTNYRSPNNRTVQSALPNNNNVKDMAAFADIEEEVKAAAAAVGESVRVLDVSRLLVDGSDVVNRRGCLTFSVTLRGCNCRHAACEVLRKKTGRGIDLTSWIATETRINAESTFHFANAALLVSQRGAALVREAYRMLTLSPGTHRHTPVK